MEIKRFIKDLNTELAKRQTNEKPNSSEVPKIQPVEPEPKKVEVETVKPLEEVSPSKTEVLPDKVETTEKTETQLIMDIQLELNRLNCGAGKADGIWGPNSRNAFDRLLKILPESLKPKEFNFNLVKQLIINLPNEIKCSPKLPEKAVAQLQSGVYVHSTTCNGKTRHHWVELRTPHLGGQNVRIIPDDVTHSFSIAIKGRFSSGYYGLSNSLFGHWKFSGWVYRENNTVRFEANPYATKHSKTKAELNINSTYKITSLKPYSAKGYFGKDKAGCQVVGKRVDD